MQWLEWGDAAFDEARSRRAPIVLLVHASWCRFSRDLRERVLVDGRVLEALSRDFVCIAVERDRRPELSVRYARGGWPTLAFLDESGELFAADGFLEPDELLARLALVASYWKSQREALLARLESQSGLGESGAVARAQLAPELLANHARELSASADPIHGGWGAQHKFAHPESLDFALLRWSRSGDETMRKLVLRTLQNMQSGEIHDRVDGGFYRYATAPDWSGPHHEKLLDGNAERLRIYLEAHQALGDASLRATAEGVLEWMLGTLLDRRTGAFRGSQRADPIRAHLRSREARAGHGVAELDATVFADANALATSALLVAGDVLARPECTEHALRALEFVLHELYEPRAGVQHYWDGAAHVPGLLRDQALVLLALLDAAEHTGRSRYLELARELAAGTVERLWSDEGGFWDLQQQAPSHGAMRRRRRTLADNARMAEGLLRLGLMTREPRWSALARETLESFAGEFRRHGHAASSYARAASLLLNDPLHVVIVGIPERDDTRSLQRAALSHYAGQRIVQIVDPGDRAALQRFELAWEDGPAQAFVRQDTDRWAATDDPERLPALLIRLEYA